MKKETLVQSAAKLVQPSPESTEELNRKKDQMTSILNAHFLQRPDLTQLIGHGNSEMMLENHRNHIRFMCSLLGEYQPEVLVDTVLWVFRAYRSHGFQLTYWPAQLDKWVEITKNNLSKEAFDEIYPFYNWMIINNPAFATLSDQAIQDDSKFNPGNLHD